MAHLTNEEFEKIRINYIEKGLSYKITIKAKKIGPFFVSVWKEFGLGSKCIIYNATACQKLKALKKYGASNYEEVELNEAPLFAFDEKEL